MTRDEIDALISKAQWDGTNSHQQTERDHLTMPVTWRQVERFANLVAQEAARQERERYRELVTLYQHSAMTDDEFTLNMIDLIELRARSAASGDRT